MSHHERDPDPGPIATDRVQVATDLGQIATDSDAFEAFYREHVGPVQRFVARRTSDPWTAADLTADIFLTAIEAAPSYRPERGSATGWLFGIARNVVRSQARRSARELSAVREVVGRRLLDGESLARAEERIAAVQDPAGAVTTQEVTS